MQLRAASPFWLKKKKNKPNNTAWFLFCQKPGKIVTNCPVLTQQRLQESEDALFPCVLWADLCWVPYGAEARNYNAMPWQTSLQRQSCTDDFTSLHMTISGCSFLCSLGICHRRLMVKEHNKRIHHPLLNKEQEKRTTHTKKKYVVPIVLLTWS